MRERGSVIVTGTTGEDMLTIKYSGTDGTLLWQKRNTNGVPQTLAVDSGGNVVVTGTYWYWDRAPDVNAEYYTAKYAAADGALLWEQRYNGPANGRDEALAMAVDGSGNVVVTGSSFSTEYYTAKYAAA